MDKLTKDWTVFNKDNNIHDSNGCPNPSMQDRGQMPNESTESKTDKFPSKVLHSLGSKPE
jgi:hypothetical protein